MRKIIVLIIVLCSTRIITCSAAKPYISPCDQADGKLFILPDKKLTYAGTYLPEKYNLDTVLVAIGILLDKNDAQNQNNSSKSLLKTSVIELERLRRKITGDLIQIRFRFGDRKNSKSITLKCTNPSDLPEDPKSPYAHETFAERLARLMTAFARNPAFDPKDVGVLLNANIITQTRGCIRTKIVHGPKGFKLPVSPTIPSKKPYSRERRYLE